MRRYRFDTFVVSPRRRMLLHEGRELPLIPRYFDLLVYLIEHRHDAVHRRDIFDRVWADVIVSDSALNQAIRTLRRTLGDDSREPRFIRTVSRHGYRFVFRDVIEEQDDAAESPEVSDQPPVVAPPTPAPDPFEPLLERLTTPVHGIQGQEEQREAAEVLHSLGTSEALRRLGTRPGHAVARALLRDTRWESPNADPVPVLGAPSSLAVGSALLQLRLRRAARLVALRWSGAAFGGSAAGLTAGLLGGWILTAVPGTTAPAAVVPVLAVIGAACGAIGGAGVGAGLAVAEATARSWRAVGLICGAGVGGALVGAAVQWVGTWSLAALVGVRAELGGGLEGVVLGAAAGIGYAIATADVEHGLAAPRGRRRIRAAVLTALACAIAALGLAVAGRPLVGGTLHVIARTAAGSQVTLTPLGRLIGEPDFGPLSRAVIGAGEGALFGFGVALGLMRRPRS